MGEADDGLRTNWDLEVSNNSSHNTNSAGFTPRVRGYERGVFLLKILKYVKYFNKIFKFFNNLPITQKSGP